MKTASVASMKGRKQLQELPSEGTRLRRLYDWFKEDAGYVVQFDPMEATLWNTLQHDINQLNTFWGCDIRHIGKTGSREYILAGEWVNDEYVDYVAQRAEKEDK